MKLLLIFAVVQLINVVLNTIKAILTVKGTKFVASIANAVTYGFYTIVVVLTASDDMSLWAKIAITVGTNLIGVYFGMWILEKFRKDKLWAITATINLENANSLEKDLQLLSIPFAWQNASYPKNKAVFNIYSYSQKQSNVIKDTLKYYNAKYIVYEEGAKL